jgi:phospholipid/cholesterol/gamma-HCH transport system substrate-binding protein
MARQKQVTWTELRVGLFVLAATALLVLVIFYVTGPTALGAKYRLHTLLPEVDGLAQGAPVRIDGVDVGNVETIQIASPKPGEPPAKARNIEVVMRIQQRFQDYIRSDSAATLITEGVLGNRYVDIDRGFVGAVLMDGQEIQGREETSFQAVVESSADLMQKLTGISQQASAILTDVRAGHGTLGKLVVDDTAYNRFNSSLDSVDQVLSGVRQGKGTLGKLVTNDELYNNVNSATSRVDNILEAVQTQKGTLGKIVYDPQLHDSALKMIDSGNGFLGDMRAGKGTLGKLATDDSLFAQYKQIGENLSTATAKLNSNQNTMGKFFSDPNLYDNLTGLTGDARLLIKDFRTDPKKFLRVKFGLF